ncbi:family 43 glycosylhydrolase [Cellulomonas fengjieae]|uniref:Family 43 glycosylhydrolase n=1 Tax=Cellulomonas fengjieae TaxID=2819978 RepID=A0ABS3SJP2_9CELL|nr:family 43 glycosylhydrolase [Cellulomonas fengjieae]MBO3085973.1 family 43 glycosylhydrolase [Cellulomonas fengjieae]QVI65956.1 family 43 glycosylhydrolase [Cellulomonas fengjieae]
MIPRLLTVTLTVALVLTAPGAAVATGDRGRPDGTPYANPVSAGFADTYADPAVIRGKDGWWYAYGTTDPLREGEGTRHLVPISRSADLVTWEYVGDAFTEDTLPAWADRERGAAVWAPDIRYVDGQYRLYVVVTQTTVTAEANDSAIGVATAPTPTGPWTATEQPVVGPRHGSGGSDDFLWTFDPSHVVGPDGTEHLFYGSYYGGIWVTPLSDDGTAAVGEPVQVTIDNKYEGAYVVRRDGWWYLFASSANCCAGPTTGYSVHVGRSRDLTGPYVDREGVPLNQSRAGGTPVLAPNGNRWVGTGHNAVVTDLGGQDWMVYHAIDRADPYLDGTDGINERPMLLDRLDWIDGWPTVRAGAWASEGREAGPVADGATGFHPGIPRGWTTWGRWVATDGTDAGRHLVSRGDAALTRAVPGRDVRVEADVRLDPGTSTVGLTTGHRGRSPRAAGLTATVDPVARALVLTAGSGRSAVRGTAALPADLDLTDWHALALTVRGGVATAELTHARLGDPLALVTLDVPRHVGGSGRAGAVATGPGAHVDNLSVLRATRPVTESVPPQQPGVLDPALGDELDGGALGPGWTTVRDPQVTVAGGVLRWPTEATDLVGTVNDAGLLLRDVPETDWVAETRLTIDLGTDTVRNFQQGGIVAYVDDDRWARLSHVAIWNTRQTEFGTEQPYAGRLPYGGTIVGPPAETTWLRLAHRTDDAGEHEVQAFTSTDGTTWVAGGVWTFPAGSDLRVGLVSHGGTGATAQFDYLRVYRPAP